jgi:hypothetical protein
VRPHRTIRVPAAQASALVEALLTTYAVKADALAAAAIAYQDDREPLAVVHDARRELLEAEDALDAVAWGAGAHVQDLELSGPTGFVRETLYAALLAAAESAAEACREYEAGRTDRPALARAVADVDALHVLFAELEASDAL